jgi:hypothetical protein
MDSYTLTRYIQLLISEVNWLAMPGSWFCGVFETLFCTHKLYEEPGT